VQRLKYEPAALAAFSQAILNLAAIPFHLDATFIAAANAVVISFAGLFVRSRSASKAGLEALAASESPGG
jgi:hypothetical protein